MDSLALLDHPAINQRLFFPRAHPPDAPFSVPCDDAVLACWRDDGGAGPKLFVHFHGNGEVVADYLPDYAADVAGLGVGVFLAEYRGYGGSTGTPALGRMLGDTEAVFAAIDRPASELVVYGRSIGSIFAIEFAHRHPDVGGLIVESGIADVLERLLVRVTPGELGVTPDQLSAAVAEHLDHQRKLAGYTGPLLVIHARDDPILDPSHAERNHAWAASERKQLVLFDHGGHNAILPTNWPAYLAALQQFIAAL